MAGRVSPPSPGPSLIPGLWEISVFLALCLTRFVLGSTPLRPFICGQARVHSSQFTEPFWERGGKPRGRGLATSSKEEDKIWGETGDSVFVLPANLAPRRAEGGIPNVGAGEEDGKKSDYSFSPH
jgi:hypothetical protein